MILEPCDIFFTRSKTWLGWLIRTCTRAPGESRTWAQHVGMIVSEGEDLDAIAIEALTTVERHPLRDEYGDGKTELIVYRPINLTDAEKIIIMVAAHADVGKQYGYGKLLLHFGDWCCSEVVGRDVCLFRRLALVDKFPICSFAVARWWAAAKKFFGVKVGAASPDDIWDFCQGNPDKYQRVSG
jgi:hypothetical protein